MSTRRLRHRLEILERSFSQTDKAREELIQNALFRISPENLESLIDATLAPRKGRELNAREAAAKQAYALEIAAQCRCHGLKVTRTPEAPELINQAAMRRLTTDVLELSAGALRAILRGFTPTTDEQAALEESFAVEEAQYPRAGFSSKAEFTEWYGNENIDPRTESEIVRKLLSLTPLTPNH